MVGKFYTGLSALRYDAFFTEIDTQELAYYCKLLNPLKAALELGCGTGRLLLPLLQQGYLIEGLDNAPAMLAQCKKKAKSLGLNPLIYEQSAQEMDLPKRYDTIFSALGTFQQIADRADARTVIERSFTHLLPGGKLLIYLYLPWYDAPSFGQWHQHEPVEHEGCTILVHEKSIHDPHEQLIFSRYRYEVWRENVLEAQEEKEQIIRWYSHYEFRMMLERAGFLNIAVSAGYEGEGPFDTMLFCAQKP